MPQVTAARLIRWMEGLKITEGPLAGTDFKAMPFQRQFVRGIMAKGVKEGALSVARWNGKTTLLGALGAASFIGPLALPRGQSTIIASSLGQAKITFDHAKFFLLPEFDREPRRYRLIDNSHQCSMQDRETGSILKAIGSDGKRAHGLAPAMLLLDEPAQWPKNDGKKMYAACVSALGKQPTCLMLAVGTRSDDPLHWFSRMLNGGPGVYAQIHCAAKGSDDWSDKAMHDANPALHDMPHMMAEFKRLREKAKTDPRELSIFRAYNLNKGTSDVETFEAIVSSENWAACEVPIAPARVGPVFVSFDLGGSSSMTCAANYWPESGRFEVRGAFPAEPNLTKRGAADGVGDRYLHMQERGELRVFPGKVTPVGRFLEWVAESIKGEDVELALADRYRQAEAEQAMATAGVHWPMNWRAVGAGSDGSADVRAFQAEVLDAHLRLAPSLLMGSAIAESKVGRDTNGNERLDKMRSNGRIDAVQAGVLAVGAGRRWRLPSVEEDLVDRSPSDYVLHEMYT